MGQSTTSGGRGRLFWQVSALVLVAVGAGGRKAEAATGQSAGGLTLELQGQYTFNDTGSTDGVFPGFNDADTDRLTPRNGYDVGGEVIYQRPGTPWSFGLGVRYGRMQSDKHSFHTTYATKYAFSEQAREKLDETHYVVDFEVGKDVGVGLFGTGVTTIGGGVRYAHFDATVTGSFSSSSKYGWSASGRFKVRHTDDAVGPRLFIKSTSAIPGGSGFSVSGGAGVGVLFGRQIVHADVHLTSGSYSESRSKWETSPTVDGFLELNWAAPKSPFAVGVGYRVDAYFDILDAGLLTPREISSVEHGPYLDLVWKIR